jgi:pyruvate/2-oxoglutarate/acetoin dehydrogenase E1 component/TPP-dependent pyruvate/acetoin dehydrogenase alpha subunit
MTEDLRQQTDKVSPKFTAESILRDYRTAFLSRQASLLGRREVLTGKAKFGIFGGGKEVAQVALARAFRPGDIRSGYYRDQTLMLALGLLTVEQLFAQLYADPDPQNEPSSAGRQMNAHFATRFLDADGAWLPLKEGFHTSADVSPTGSQMPRLVGLALASRLYRELDGLEELSGFSNNGDEIAFGTIGNATCAEGLFWESINAAGLLRAPMLLSIWDDGYGISVPNEYQITKSDISALIRGFQRAPGTKEGFDIYTVRGWDYPSLCETYLSAAEIVRREHVPAIVHVREMTQPQGHSTSGSHERYKSQARLEWEEEYDGVTRMREWILKQGIAGEKTLEEAEEEDIRAVRESQRQAWARFRKPLEEERQAFVDLAARLEQEASHRSHQRALASLREGVGKQPSVLRRDLVATATRALILVRGESSVAKEELIEWRRQQLATNRRRYGSELYSGSAESALRVEVREAKYADDAPRVKGYEVINACFDAALERFPNLIAFGEDVGQLGDVNQGMMGLQEKYGDLRVTDTGIREATILGQAIGLALRGFRPIPEIQYLDYLLYALQILSDDLATLRWRTRGGQKAPVIVRTRGHRLEGVWHSGSPMAGIISLVRGVYVCAPRNMIQAAGFYNTLLEADDPAVVVEVLNGYRAKERLPSNIGEFTVPLGVPETIREGHDLTLVTYGACCKISLAAADLLEEVGIDAEVIDVRTLLPFDLQGRIAESIRRTNRVLFVDEDVPGGASAYLMQQVLEEQGGYQWLDGEPVTVTARPHRPAYGSDGDYFSKPNREEIFEAAYGIMRRADPRRFPTLGI